MHGSACVTSATPFATAAAITLAACNASDPAQQWTVPADHNTTIALLGGTWMWASVPTPIFQVTPVFWGLSMRDMLSGVGSGFGGRQTPPALPD